MKSAAHRMRMAVEESRPHRTPPVWWAEFATLTKARLNALVLITTVVGFVLASPGALNWWLLLATLIGTWLVAAGAAVLNQLVEIQQDALMERTRDRPLAKGTMPSRQGLRMGLILSTTGLLLLAWQVNALATWVAFLTLVTYVAVYTPLKRTSSTCTLVGAVAGALPPIIGWVAAGGALGIEAAFLFGLLFFWQLPHFLAINWLYREEYERAGFVMWSNGDDSGVRTSRLILIFTVMLVALTVALIPAEFASWSAVVSAAVLGSVLFFLSIRFALHRTRVASRTLFFATLFYLPLLLSAIIFGN